MISRRLLVILLLSAIVLPIVIAVVLGTAGLLRAMGDLTGGRVLSGVGLALGIAWIVDLICVVLALAAAQVAGGKDEDEEERP